MNGRGGHSERKKQADFDQLKRLKLDKIDLMTERCKNCHEVFTSETLANIHVRQNSCLRTISRKRGPMKNVNCEICSETFPSRLEYTQHNLKYHTDKTYECIDCFQGNEYLYYLLCQCVFATSLQYNDNITMDKRKIRKILIRLGFKRKSDWQRHRRELHQPNKFSCCECEFSAARQFSI